MDEKEFLQVIWKYIGKHGTIINNQNIDWLVYEAFKEYNQEKAHLLKLPCKIGDKVYIITKENIVVSAQVEMFVALKDCVEVYVAYEDNDFHSTNDIIFYTKQFDTVIFLDKAKAESKALALKHNVKY